MTATHMPHTIDGFRMNLPIIEIDDPCPDCGEYAGRHDTAAREAHGIDVYIPLECYECGQFASERQS